MQPGSALDGKIPIFVFPRSVDFYLEDRRTHKRVVTLYNPYDFAVRFTVLGTDPGKYTVVDSEGAIKAKCQIDIVIRHRAPTPANCNVTDKFRIEMFHHDTKQLIGRKDITAILHSGSPTLDDDNESTSSTDRVSEWRLQSQRDLHRDHQVLQKHTTNPVVLLLGLVCVVALILPNEGETESRIAIPPYIKLVFSYVLGLVTMEIFRS